METLYFGKTYDEVFEDSWSKFIRGREDHEFNHYNNSLGMQIYSKEHLKYEMKRRRMFPLEVCERLADDWDSKHKHHDINYEGLSEKAKDIINSIKVTADKNGNIKLGDRAINALVEMGAIQKQTDFKGFEGGFS